ASTPLFSGLVEVTATYLEEWLFYIYYLLILGVYFYSLFGLFKYLAMHPSSVGRIGNPSNEVSTAPPPLASLCFVTLAVLMHAGIVRAASARLLSTDYPWFFQSGVAGQYVLGFGLQPSTFGVFMLASILAFVRERPWLAVILACLAAILHATYLPAAAFLTFAYMLIRYRQRGLGGRKSVV